MKYKCKFEKYYIYSVHSNYEIIKNYKFIKYGNLIKNIQYNNIQKNNTITILKNELFILDVATQIT